MQANDSRHDVDDIRSATVIVFVVKSTMSTVVILIVTRLFS